MSGYSIDWKKNKNSFSPDYLKSALNLVSKDYFKGQKDSIKGNLDKMEVRIIQKDQNIDLKRRIISGATMTSPNNRSSSFKEIEHFESDTLHHSLNTNNIEHDNPEKNRKLAIIFFVIGLLVALFILFPFALYLAFGSVSSLFWLVLFLPIISFILSIIDSSKAMKDHQNLGLTAMIVLDVIAIILVIVFYFPPLFIKLGI